MTHDATDQHGSDGDGREERVRRDRAGPGSADPERESSATTWLLGGVLVVLLGLAGAGLYFGLVAGASGSGDGSGSPVEEGPGGDRAELSVPAAVVRFPTLSGDTASLADYHGDVVVLNLWGTWCHPCRREIPDLVELQERIEPRGGTVVGLAVDSGSPSSIRDFVEEFDVNYPVWYARGGEVVSHYRAMGYPTTLLIDREGIIRRRFLGPQTTESLLQAVEPLLSRES